MHLLIAYRYLSHHNDPLFEEFTYGDVNARARRLKKDLQKGDYVFFHTGKDGKKFITAYYVVDRVLDTETAVKDKEIVENYKSPHIKRFLSGGPYKLGKIYTDDVMIFGDTSKSRVLDQDDWILFDRALIEKLSLNVVFHDHRTENQNIVSATRQYRNLTDEDVKTILSEIDLSVRKQFVEEKRVKSPRKFVKINKESNPTLVTYERPDWLMGLIGDIEKLRNDPEHKERAHESLVETFYELLGFVKYTNIKHRQGRIDISIEYENKLVAVNEVKKDWRLFWKDKKVLMQAYNYALETGARYVILTNGDYYAILDKEKGDSYVSQFVGDFKLTQLKSDDLKFIEIMKKENLINKTL